MKNKTWKSLESTNVKSKTCFCIGPENCGDSSCRLVKEYNEVRKGGL